MQKFTFIIIAFFCAQIAMAQTEYRALKLSLQTDLIAYTTPGGWSIWGVAQHHQNKISLAYEISFMGPMSNTIGERWRKIIIPTKF